MIDTGLALRYAHALYEAAPDRRAAAAVREDMATLDRIMTGAPAIRRYCLRGREDRAPERDFLRIAFLPYVGPATGATLEAAVHNGRIGIIPHLPAAYREVLDRWSDTMTVVVETAQPPAPELLAAVEAKMQARTRRAVRLQSRVVPEQMAGWRIHWDHRVIDASAAGRLKQLRAWIIAG